MTHRERVSLEIASMPTQKLREKRAASRRATWTMAFGVVLMVAALERGWGTVFSVTGLCVFGYGCWSRSGELDRHRAKTFIAFVKDALDAITGRNRTP